MQASTLMHKKPETTGGLQLAVWPALWVEGSEIPPQVGTGEKGDIGFGISL